MGSERQTLNMNLDGLDDFAPKPAAAKPLVTREQVDKVSSFPSREASIEGQLSIKSPDGRILDRFKAMCKDDRRKYYEMLEILMDAYEGRGNGSKP